MDRSEEAAAFELNGAVLPPTKSNEANHEIVLVSAADAEKLLTFTGMLLKVVYEFPAAMKQKQPQVAAPTPAAAPTKPPTIPVTAPKPAP